VEPTAERNDPAVLPEGGTAYQTPQRFEGRNKWLAALDDFRNWLIREAA